MTDHMMPAEIVGAERHVYSVGADRARKAYRTKHGANVTLSLAERRAWNESHAAGLAAAAMRGGMTAVRKMHRDRVEMLATMTAPGRISPARGAHLAILERDAAHAAERLEVLATVGKAPAKRAARKPVAVPEARPEAAAVAQLRRGSKLAPCERHAEHWGRMTPADRFRAAVEGGVTPGTCVDTPCMLTPGTDRYAASFVAAGPVPVGSVAETVETAPESTPVETVAPETVPDPLPPMTRAARKATRREIARAMRAAGVKPEGQAWRDACRAAGLPVADETVSA